MAGRNRQPLRVIKGNARSNHITKNEMKKRLAHEDRMRGPTENIIAPPYLTAVQKREFDEIAAELVKLEIFSELEIDVLARYLDSKYQYVQVVKDLRKMKPTFTVKGDDGKSSTFENEDYRKLIKTKNLLFNECRAAATDLGLTINARLKLVFPGENVKPEPSEFERKFGDI